MSQAFRCDGLDTPQAYIWNKKNSQKNWDVEILGLSPNNPFWAPGDPQGAWYQVKVCGDHKFNPIRQFEGIWDQIWPTGALLGPPKSPKGPFWGLLMSSVSPGGPDLVPTTPDWPAWVEFMVTTHFDLVSGPFHSPILSGCILHSA